MARWTRVTTRLAILARDGFKCVYCLHGATRKGHLTLDHITPRYLGGSNHHTNLVTACESCNYHRARRSLHAWLQVLKADPKVIPGSRYRVWRALRKPIDRKAARVLCLARFGRLV